MFSCPWGSLKSSSAPSLTQLSLSHTGCVVQSLCTNTTNAHAHTECVVQSLCSPDPVLPALPVAAIPCQHAVSAAAAFAAAASPAACLLLLLPTGEPMEYFYRHLYLPQLGMFSTLPEELQLGSYQEEPNKPVALGYLDEGGFVKDGVSYK